MKDDDRALLEELKGSLKIKLHRACVEAYLDDPTPEALMAKVLEDLQRFIDEAR